MCTLEYYPIVRPNICTSAGSAIAVHSMHLEVEVEVEAEVKVEVGSATTMGGQGCGPHTVRTREDATCPD
ncbi:hypothetical protein TcWFU_008640 [Taenia crassiceps]|uniref:Uncharacterized protein n=1 Tax=Taenia crassiceps TaxID=6207 RepID=A0ABR4Q8K4_9CEST